MPKNTRSNLGLILGAIALVSVVAIGGFITVAVLVLRNLVTPPVAVYTEPAKAPLKAKTIVPAKPALKAKAPEKPAELAAGKEAPEIEGEDVDGEKFKLSDYRGKVVLLDFWGHW